MPVGFRPVRDVVVREVPSCFDKAIGSTAYKRPDVSRAREQHEAYVRALRKAGARVHYLPRNDGQPDSVFVEDIAVVIGGKALLTRPGSDSRRLELSDDLHHFFADGFGLEVSEVEAEDATLDGGDVIFTGREIIAGLSRRTNDRGVEEVRRNFPAYRVVTVDVCGPLHLTTLMGLFDEDTLCVSTETNHGGNMFDQIAENSRVRYRKVEVAEDLAANCLAVNGRLLCKSRKECPESHAIMKEAARDREVIGLDISEIEKALGSLSCMSIRFNSQIRGCCPTC